MKRENFIFTVGYKGKYAIVDRSSRRKYYSLSSIDLLKKGLLKFSFSAALYDLEIKKKDIEEYLENFKKLSLIDANLEDLKIMFGVFAVPDIKDCIFI